MWTNTLKYINKPTHIQHKINKYYHYFKKKHTKHQLCAHLEKRNTIKDVKLTSNLKYKERV